VRPSLKNPEINVRGLTRRFAQTIAVDHIDLTVAEGDIFGLLGANGAGKSTVIKMLTTLLKPSAGSASVAGFDIVSQAPEVFRLPSFTASHVPCMCRYGGNSLRSSACC
jgi:ABC-type multidrug transport system ATPase subunit